MAAAGLVPGREEGGGGGGVRLAPVGAGPDGFDGVELAEAALLLLGRLHEHHGLAQLAQEGTQMIEA